MIWKPIAVAAGLIALAAPLIGRTDAPPQVIVATPGSAGGNGGVIDRFTMRFSEPMVPLGDPRATSPIAMKCTVSGTGRWVDQQGDAGNRFTGSKVIGRKRKNNRAIKIICRPVKRRLLGRGGD